MIPLLHPSCTHKEKWIIYHDPSLNANTWLPLLPSCIFNNSQIYAPFNLPPLRSHLEFSFISIDDPISCNNKTKNKTIKKQMKNRSKLKWRRTLKKQNLERKRRRVIKSDKWIGFTYFYGHKGKKKEFIIWNFLLHGLVNFEISPLFQNLWLHFSKS